MRLFVENRLTRVNITHVPSATQLKAASVNTTKTSSAFCYTLAVITSPADASSKTLFAFEILRFALRREALYIICRYHLIPLRYDLRTICVCVRQRYLCGCIVWCLANALIFQHEFSFNVKPRSRADATRLLAVKLNALFVFLCNQINCLLTSHVIIAFC